MFKEIPASKSSLSRRKLSFGVAINDAEYITQLIVGGKHIQCPYYNKWQGILKRCYSPKFHKKHPTYKDCSVVAEWLLFSNFKSWMMAQDWQGNEIDKDVKIKGNKIYSPETCLFIPAPLNTLLIDGAGHRGDYPVGVYRHTQCNRFAAQISYNGKSKHLGLFKTPEDASQAYQEARSAKIKKLIIDNAFPMATDYLNQHVANNVYK